MPKGDLLKYLNSGGVPIVTGFQGINNFSRLTTIGRSGSDASAIMIAKFLKADECIIYTDVDGIYTTDPRLHKKAKKIKQICKENRVKFLVNDDPVLAKKLNADGRILDFIL